MLSKFEQVPTDSETKILYQHQAKLGDYDVLYQIWHWDGIKAESIIFASEDVSTLDDDKLKREISQSRLLKENSSITLKRNESGFTFVNFNFETDE
ncbi:hypothetical protein Ping_1911 [Psychromonas ingrahamii 37]|uniref:Uncharacterized protein n=1 Tax=Psychromonas ingrahamii (strain DSM 17664 / CCUG 51855 / 37) TaxID=357804 RepID=A1SW20_PSYIN|nr:hypothetical protein [Psychromonas ingrahamii]ABM03685.1 hypothetical protein Ping_1911 [Psychromonas ingrahamii 37]